MRLSDDPADMFVGIFIGALAGLIIIGPLATGIGFIFTTFLKSIGIGIVSFVFSVIAGALLFMWAGADRPKPKKKEKPKLYRE